MKPPRNGENQSDGNQKNVQLSWDFLPQESR